MYKFFVILHGVGAIRPPKQNAHCGGNVPPDERHNGKQPAAPTGPKNGINKWAPQHVAQHVAKTAGPPNVCVIIKRKHMRVGNNLFIVVWRDVRL